MIEELALEGTDPRAPTWKVSDRGGRFRCAVVGAGASGLAAAHRLRQAGVDVTVFEKNGDVGGTWLENVYPGCRVDVPNQLYSFSFAQTDDWASRFSSQPDLLAYLQNVAKEFELGGCIRFHTEVTEARFDEDGGWELTVRTEDEGGGTVGDEVAEAARRSSTSTRSSAPRASSTDPRSRTSPDATGSPDRRSTRRPGTTPSS